MAVDPDEPKGNFLGEWFGFRVWPPQAVDDSEVAQHHQSKRLCPFISAATREESLCIKAKQKGADPTGVCTISSDSNKSREDWLACPFRLLDRNFTLLEDAIRTVCKIDKSERLALFSITVLNRPQRRNEILRILAKKGARVFLFTANKLGGEVDIPETDSSPGGKVDFSVMEATLTDGKGDLPLGFGKVMMFEIQTADFHGSPTHAVNFLREVCPPGHGQPYHERIRSEPDRVGRRVEGPNKANIFKRTIYQMLYKMEVSRDPSCAGFVIVLPLPVWTSWLRHLGKPALEPDEDDPRLLRLRAAPLETEADREQEMVNAEPAWIFVFDIDRASPQSPKPLVVVHRIATDAASLMYFAFEVAAKRAIDAGAVIRYRKAFINRIRKNWLTKVEKKANKS